MEPLILNPVVRDWLRDCQTLTSTSTDEREAARELSDTLFARHARFAMPDAERVTHAVTAAGRSLRMDEYRPRSAVGSVVAAYLYLHGGAFRLGQIDEAVNVALCAARAAEAGVAVFSLEYSLAPERPYPAALDDAAAALRYLHENAAELMIDADAIVVGGVSAGANIAAALGLSFRDAAVPIRGLLLEVPVVDLRNDGTWAGQYASVNGFTTIADLRGPYAPASLAGDPALSPVLDDLDGLPQTHVMIAEYDPLSAGGAEFVRRLRAAGNEVTATIHLGELHASHGLGDSWRGARRWQAEVATVLRDFTR